MNTRRFPKTVKLLLQTTAEIGARLGNKKGEYDLTYIFESGSGSDAGLEVGKTYLIYAQSASFEVYGTNQCSGTIEISKAQQSLIQLRKIKEAFDAYK